RDAAPGFWRWPELFSEDERKFERPGVRMRIGGDTIVVNMFGWKLKRDFRLRSESLRSAGQAGDILRIERAAGVAEFEYYVEIIPRATSQYEIYHSLCTHPTRNSSKLWGYY